MTRGRRKEQDGLVKTETEIGSSLKSLLIGKARKLILRDRWIGGDYLFPIDTV